MRVPFAGGGSEDMTPCLSPYSVFGGVVSATGDQLAFTRADPEGFGLTVIDLGPDREISEPRVLFRSDQIMLSPILSPQGHLAVVASAERSTMQHYTLLAFDTRTGERVAELWDGEGTSVAAVLFERHSATENGDPRLAGTTNRSGFVRPLIWHPRSGERHDLLVDELDGDVRRSIGRLTAIACCYYRRAAPGTGSGPMTWPATTCTRSSILQGTMARVPTLDPTVTSSPIGRTRPIRHT